MAARTIFHDTVLNFGKYKGRAVEDILKSDTGYFLWLSESGVGRLDSVLKEAVAEWAAKNPGEARRVKRSAQKAAAASPASRPAPAAGETPPVVAEVLAKLAQDDANESVTPDEPALPAVVSEAWGTW